MSTTVLLLLGHCVLVELGQLFAGSFDASPATAAEVAVSLQRPELGWAIIVIVIYAGARVLLSNPLCQPAYYRWLSTIPWRAGMPLPLTNLSLAVEDILPVTAAAILTSRAGGNPLVLLTVFVGVYCAVLALSSQRWLGWFSLYAMPIVAGVLFLVWSRPWWQPATALAALGIVSQIGVWRLLPALPWKVQADAERRREEAQRSTKDWYLGPLEPNQPLRALHVMMPPLVSGWCIFCTIRGGGYTSWDGDPGCWMMFGIYVMWVAMARVLIYGARFHPPISTLGRLWIGQWLIPGYDSIWIAPLCIVATGIALPAALWFAGFSPPVTFGISVTAVLAAALAMPPTLRTWQLTGHHRVLRPQHQVQQGRHRRRMSAGDTSTGTPANFFGLLR